MRNAIVTASLKCEIACAPVGLSHVFTYRYFDIESFASENVQVRSLSATASLQKSYQKQNLQSSYARKVDYIRLKVDFRLLLSPLRLDINKKDLVSGIVLIAASADECNARIEL